jgi:hypothetical protein
MYERLNKEYCTEKLLIAKNQLELALLGFESAITKSLYGDNNGVDLVEKVSGYVNAIKELRQEIKFYEKELNSEEGNF